MNVLTQLLPGLRDVRAPLFAGYIWLVAIWLLISDSVPERAAADGIFESLYRLGDAVSGLGIAVALSFVAYVLGASSWALTRTILRPAQRFLVAIQVRFSRRDLRFGQFASSDTGDPLFLPPSQMADLAVELAGKVSIRALRDLETFSREKLTDLIVKLKLPGRDEDRSAGAISEARRLEGFLEFTYEDVDSQSARQERLSPFARMLFDLSRDLDLVSTRLIGVNAQLYSEYDRLRGEAEFRFAIAPALGALAIILAVETSWAWLLGAPGAVLLFADGLRISSEAGDVLAGALRAEAVASGVIERLALRMEDVRARFSSEQSNPTEAHF